jgi:hypothetical protein
VTLDEFVDEGIRRGRKCEPPYVPTRFMQMRDRYGTVEAIKHLMLNSDPQSGFRRLVDCGLKEWTLEAAVVSDRFKSLFPDKLIQANAQARLDGLFDA